MTYQTTKTIQRGSCTIILHRPVLTKEETARREKQVCAVLETTVRDYITRKERNT